MDAVRDVVLGGAVAAQGARACGCGCRWPSLTVADAGRVERCGRSPTWSPTRSTSRTVVFTDDLAAYCEQVLTLVPRALGPRLGGAGPAGDQGGQGRRLVAGRRAAGRRRGVTLQEGEYELKLVAADAEHSAPLPGGEGVVVLDTAVTPELAAEGLARDVVRVVQQARRDADLAFPTGSPLVVDASGEVAAAVRTHRSTSSPRETLARRRSTSARSPRGLRRRGRRRRDRLGTRGGGVTPG